MGGRAKGMGVGVRIHGVGTRKGGNISNVNK